MRRQKFEATGNYLGRGYQKSIPMLYAKYGAERPRPLPYWLALPIMLFLFICAKLFL